MIRPPILVSWGARILYIGPELPAPGASVAVLALALKAPNEDAAWRSTVAACEHVNLPGRGGSEQAFLYLDRSSHDLDILRSACRQQTEHAGYGLWAEDQIGALLAGMERSAGGWEAIRVPLGEMLGLERRGFDRRIDLALRAVGRDPAITAASVAQEAGMSPSYFQHVFKRGTGLAFRRYAKWMHVRHALGVRGEGDLAAAVEDIFGTAPFAMLPAGTVKLVSVL